MAPPLPKQEARSADKLKCYGLEQNSQF